MSLDLPNPEQLAATAANILMDQGKIDAVVLLLECDLKVEWSSDSNWDGAIDLTLYGPYLTLKDFIQQLESRRPSDFELYESIRDAFNLSLAPGFGIYRIYARVKPVNVQNDWKSELLKAIQGEKIHNQAVSNQNTQIHVWEGLRFRSQTEVKIAQAFDRAGVLFFPNCKARLGQSNNRANREPDFLVCHKGKWGILEVDGEPYHPATRTTQDHAKDRLFKPHGIRFFEHYDAQECYNKPDQVVREFLQNLENA
jgi:hypothetical protein